MRHLRRIFASAALCIALAACGGGGDVSIDGGTGDAVAIEPGNGSSDRLGAVPDTASDELPPVPVAGLVPTPVTDPSPEVTVDSGSTGIDGPTIRPAGEDVSEPSLGEATIDAPPALDESFEVVLTAVRVRRRSTGETVPIEVAGVRSGTLRLVLSGDD